MHVVVEQEEVRKQKQRRLKRRRYNSAGVMEVWTIDQHDKWIVFSLFFHVAYDPFVGKIVWFGIWWMNKNPFLITDYYLTAGRYEKRISISVYATCADSRVRIWKSSPTLSVSVSPL
jgi:hypothetical protein